jgi:hypothetical protein
MASVSSGVGEDDNTGPLRQRNDSEILCITIIIVTNFQILPRLGKDGSSSEKALSL